MSNGIGLTYHAIVIGLCCMHKMTSTRWTWSSGCTCSLLITLIGCNESHLFAHRKRFCISIGAHCHVISLGRDFDTYIESVAVTLSFMQLLSSIFNYFEFFPSHQPNVKEKFACKSSHKRLKLPACQWLRVIV